MRQYIPEKGDYELDGNALPGWRDGAEPVQRRGRKTGVLLQRTKTTKAGEHLDVDVYPVLDWAYSREAKKRGKTPEQMRKINFANRLRRFAQLMNANFGDGDLKADLTCAKECAFEDFLKIKKRFFCQLRKRFKAAGVKMEYMGIIESTHEGRRHHIHMVLRGGVITRDEVEELWGQGTANADRVRTKYEDKGLEGFARYMAQHKDTQEKLMRRAWFASKGLKKPKTTCSDRKFSRGAAARIEKAVREDAQKEFEKRYPGYRLIEYTIRYSEFLPGAYIHAHLKRIGGSP